jgi:WD40 repeat protein
MATCSGDKTIKLWDRDQGMCMRTLTHHTSTVWFVDVSADGTTMVSCSNDGKIIVCNFTHKFTLAEKQRKLTAHTACVWCVKISPDGAKLASCSADKTVRTWSVQTCKPLETFEGHEDGVLCVAWSPNSRLVASAGGDDDKSVLVWDAAAGGTQVTQPLRGHSSGVTCVAWGSSSNASSIVSGSADMTIIVWELQGASATVRHTLRGHTSYVSSVSLSPDDRFIVSGSEQCGVVAW